MVYVSDEELYSGDDDDLQEENEEATEEATEDVPKPVADESTNPTIGFLPKIPSRISVNPDINKKKENKAGHRRNYTQESMMNSGAKEMKIIINSPQMADGDSNLKYNMDIEEKEYLPYYNPLELNIEW